MSARLTRAARALGAVALGAALALGFPAGPALADAVDDAIEVLQDDSLYIDPAAEISLDEDRVLDAIGDQQLLIAVLDDSTGAAFDSATRIGLSRPENTVAVVVDGELAAGSDVVCAGVADEIAGDAVQANLDDLQGSGDVTGLLVDFAGRMESAPGLDDCPDASDGSGWLWFAGIGVAGLAGIGGYVVYRNRKKAERFEGLRASILSLYDRLAADVSNLDPGDDPVTRQAVVDAAERYTSTGALLEQADTEGEYDAARLAAIEGLFAARTARQRLGLDLGPPLPDLDPPEGEQLVEDRTVTVGEETYQGHPQYTPGAPHYYPGGRGVPGGWYPSRFWEGVLLGQVFGRGSRGGDGGGGGFGGFGGSDRWADDRPGAGMPRSDYRDSAKGGGDWGRRARGGDWGGTRRAPRRNSWGGGRRGGRRGRNSW